MIRTRIPPLIDRDAIRALRQAINVIIATAEVASGCWGRNGAKLKSFIIKMIARGKYELMKIRSEGKNLSFIIKSTNLLQKREFLPEARIACS